jgi:hypothetical protein
LSQEMTSPRKTRFSLEMLHTYKKKNTKYECRDTVCMCTLYSGIDVYKEEHIGDTHTCIHMDTAMHTERCL